MRANNLVIGSLALVVIAATFGGVLGLWKIQGIQQRAPLRIVFEGSASGLRRGGPVTFGGVEVGELISLELDNPRKIVALVMLDKSAPIRKDTVVGLQLQGLTGLAAIALTGGAATAAPVPLDTDGVPVLAADLSETETVRDTLHNIDRLLVSNRAALRETLLSFEIYTAALASRGEAIDSIIGRTESALENFDNVIAKIDKLAPGVADGKESELYRKVKSIRELAESFSKHSASLMEEGHRSLLEVSQAATEMSRKFESQSGNPPPPRRPNQKR
jgi:phospholipid/cholesterol/gamma-HCH transport system substrate-binding protein